MVHYPSLPELKKALGANYSIRTIDLEKCLYRDFGNGFNVEISGCSAPTESARLRYISGTVTVLRTASS